MSLVLYLEVVPDSVLARNRRDTQSHLTEVIFMKELLTEEWLEWQDPTRDRKYPQGKRWKLWQRAKGGNRPTWILWALEPYERSSQQKLWLLPHPQGDSSREKRYILSLPLLLPSNLQQCLPSNQKPKGKEASVIQSMEVTLPRQGI